LAIHFLLGNIIAIHTGLNEFWFVWRIEKIFLEKERLVAYCSGEDGLLDVMKVGKEQDIHYWLQGRVQQHGNKIKVILVLTNTKEGHIEWTTELTLEPTDQLIGFRTGFLTWLETCGLPLPEDWAAKTLWSEKTTLEGLGFLGRALEAFYLHSSWCDKGSPDSPCFLTGS